MARNGSGTYSRVNTFVAGETITAASHNGNWADLEAELTNSVAADGQTTMTGPFKASNGTLAAPSQTFASDTNTGRYHKAADTMADVCGGAEVVEISATGIDVTGAVAATSFSGGTGQLVPIGAVLEWYDNVLPTEGGYAWANGQIIASANTVCPILLARWGTRFGGNGTTTMGVPDRREVVGIGRGGMGGTVQRNLVTFTGYDVLGTQVGSETNTLLTANLPAYTPTGSIANGAITTTGTVNGGPAQATSTVGSSAPGGQSAGVNANTLVLASSQAASTFTGTPQGGTSTAVNNLQPVIVCNYILRIG